MKKYWIFALLFVLLVPNVRASPLIFKTTKEIVFDSLVEDGTIDTSKFSWLRIAIKNKDPKKFYFGDL